jgi:YggT family protein
MLISSIHILFQIYTLMLFGRILGSWIPEFQDTKVMQFIAFYTDPYLNLFRGIIPPLGMIDISPIFAFLALQLLEWLILGAFR